MFNVHPTASSRGGKRISFITSTSHLNDAVESDFVRCYQCGMANNLRKVQNGDSFDRNKDFIVTTQVAITAGGTQATKEFDDASMGGCRFCHSTNIEGKNRLRMSVRKPPAGYIGG